MIQAERPLKDCDIIMKCGITSGVIYAKAIFEMSEHYRFRSIGGTSSGIILGARRQSPIEERLPRLGSGIGTTGNRPASSWIRTDAPAGLRIDLCLFDPAGRRQIAVFTLPERTDEVWHGYLPNAQSGLLYGYRAYGPYEPQRGYRLCAGHAQQLGGESPPPNQMEVKG
jgi:Carbohydrate-binding module 48 (Isoamylase N-terminal domain)